MLKCIFFIKCVNYFVAYCLESSAFMPPVVHDWTGYLYSAWI